MSKLFRPTSDGVRQYKPTGVYYANKWYRGRNLQFNTGKTTKTEAVEELRIHMDKLDKGLDPTKPYPGEQPKQPEPSAGKPPELTDNATGLDFTFDDAIEKLALTIQAKQREDRITSRRSVEYREECITYVMRGWGEADIRLRQMGSFTVPELEEFRKRVLVSYGRSRYNGMMQNLRALFDEAVAAKAIHKNPCRDPGFHFVTLTVPQKELTLPTDEQFEAICNEIRGVKNGQGPWIVLSIEFVSMVGLRIDCAGRMLKSDVHLPEKHLLIRKAIYKGGLKPDAKDVIFPLYPELQTVCEKLLELNHRRGDHLLPVRDFRQSLKSACAKLGLPHLSPQDFRHLFGTKMLSPENAAHLSVADVAYLMAHKSGPQVLLRRYAHVTPHLQEAGKNITFKRLTPASGTSAPGSPAPTAPAKGQGAAQSSPSDRKSQKHTAKVRLGGSDAAPQA